MNNKKISLGALIFCFLLLPILSSCNNSLDPVNRKKGPPYSIYGILVIGSKTNYIRVKNLKIPLVADTIRSLNATVSIRNLKTGGSQLLTDDSLINFEGVVTHNFKSTLPITPVTTYEVIVKRRSDGRKATARVTTPALGTSASVSPKTAYCGQTRTAIFKKILPGEYIQARIKFTYSKTTVRPPQHILVAEYNLTPVPFYYKKSGRHSKPKSIQIQFNMKDVFLGVFYGRYIQPSAADTLPDPKKFPCAVYYEYLVSHKIRVIFSVYSYIHKHITTSDSNPIPTSQLVGVYNSDSTSSTSFILKP